jgi:hypothetical protein
MTLVDAPILLSKSGYDYNSESDCLKKLTETLIDCEYECRQTIFDADDYGPVDHHSCRILLASKIGLPELPSIFSVISLCSSALGKQVGLELKLRSCGFKTDYKVSGSTEVEKVQLIQKEVRPPLARAIALSLSSHVHKLRGGVEDYSQAVVGSRKRKAESESCAGCSKKACNNHATK